MRLTDKHHHHIQLTGGSGIARCRLASPWVVRTGAVRLVMLEIAWTMFELLRTFVLGPGVDFKWADKC